jgi:uncharacterized protein
MMLKIDHYKHHHETNIVLQDQVFGPGQNGAAILKAGVLPSGSLLNTVAHVFRSKNPGPTLLIQGGIHGDEINGIQIITTILEAKTLNSIQCGTLIAIPLVNVFSFNNLSRDLPDGKDVNRSFPGSTGGSMASRVARTLTKHILPYVDYAIDLHTGGADRYNYPQTRYSKSDPISKEMSSIFAAPFSIQNSMISNSFRKVATDMGAHTIVYEGGESVRINKTAIDQGVNGIVRVMKALDMLPSAMNIPIGKTIYIDKTDWVRASQPGLFIWLKKSGDSIKIGDVLGTIKDPYGLKSFEVISKIDGYIIGHNNAAVVNQGDPLFHIGYKNEQINK